MFYRVVTLSLLLQLWSVAGIASASGIPILGRVLDPDGEPRSKAEVHLEAIPSTYERARLRLEGRAGPEPVARVRTRADGTFQITAPKAGMWKVVVAVPGWLTMEHRLMPLVEEMLLPTVELERAAKLEVRVVDAEGKPRPGVVGAVTRGVREDSWRPQLRLAVAGDDGVASLPLGQNEKIQLEVLAAGHPLVVAEVVDEKQLTIEVETGVARTVRVTDRQKRPLADALAFQGSALLPHGLTDAEGHLTLVQPAKEPLTLQVSTLNRWSGSFELDPKTTKPKVRELQLDPPETVRGRVLDLASRDPIADALVWAVRGEPAVTDRHGGYEVEMGVYKLRWVQAAAGGYLRGFSQLSAGGDQDNVAIALAPAGVLSGKVVDDQGGLLAGVAIEIQVKPQSRRLSSTVQRLMRDGWRGRTSQRGVFRVAGLPAEVALELTCEAEGYAPQTLAIEALEASETRSEIEVVMRPGRAAFGLVVDEDDVPVAGAEVRLVAPPPTDDLRAMMRMRRSVQDAESDPVGLTDGEGRFEIRDLADGRYDLEVKASGFAPVKIPGVRLDDDSIRVDLGTVVMVQGATIEGRVMDPEGGAIVDAEVMIDLGRRSIMMRQSGGASPTKTNDQGRFVLVDLLPGQPVNITVTRQGFASESVSDVRPPTEEALAIVLRPAARLEGRVVNRQGDPIHEAKVSAYPDYRAATGVRHFGGSSQGSTDGDGRFVIENVEPGVLQVSVRAEGYQQEARPGIEVAAGAKHELEFVLDVGAVIEGTVTTATGEPVVEATIGVAEPQDGISAGFLGSANGRTDAEGRYRITGAPLGAVTVTVYHQSELRLSKSMKVQPGTQVVDLVLESGFEITGQVVSPAGDPVGGAAVSIQESSRPGVAHFAFGRSQASSATDGSFTLSSVSAGSYTVGASLEGFAPATSDLLEVSGNVTGVLLTLRSGLTLKGRVLGLELDELGALELMAFSRQGGMRRGHVDFAGEYVFDNLAAGKWQVQAEVTGSGRSSALQVELSEGVSEVIKDIEFGTGFTLTGIVLDNDQPVAGARVSVSNSKTSGGHGSTGGDGRFRIENLSAGSYQVMVMAGMGFRQAEPLELTGDHELRIETATGAISGVVRSTVDGEPLAGATVALEMLNASDDLMAAGLRHLDNRTATDSKGAFRMPRVRQGDWRVVTTKPGYALTEVMASVTGSESSELEIQLTPTEGVAFVLALQSGATVASAQIATLDPAGRRLNSGTYPVIEGRVHVSTLAPGRWVLVVQAGDGAATRVTVTSPGDQGRVVLPTAGNLHLTVPELEQEPISRVALTGPDGQPFVGVGAVSFAPSEPVMSAGESWISGLTPGVWSFTVEHPDGRTWTGSAAVTPGGTTEVILPRVSP